MGWENETERSWFNAGEIPGARGVHGSGWSRTRQEGVSLPSLAQAEKHTVQEFIEAQLARGGERRPTAKEFIEDLEQLDAEPSSGHHGDPTLN
jgi:hypothetical protein